MTNRPSAKEPRTGEPMDTTTTAPRPRIRPSLASAARELQRIAAMQTAFLTDRELDAMGDRAGWLIGYAVKTRSLTLGDVCTKLSMGQIRSELFDVEVLVDSALADLSSLVHIPDGTRGDPSPGPLFDDALATNGVRASGRKRPIQDRDADGCLSLLSGETACPQPRSDQRLVAAHRRFDQRALARAIAFQNRVRSLVRYASSHPARLNLPRKDPLEGSFCITFSAMCRSTARLFGPLPNRLLS